MIRHTSKCEYCPALVTWAKTEKGANMPCDSGLVEVLVPHAGLMKGVKRTNVIDGDGKIRIGHRLDDIREAMPLFPVRPADYTPHLGLRPHWGSCPGAEQARAARKAREAKRA